MPVTAPPDGDAAPLLLDTHDRSVAPAVWALFETALHIIGPRPTLIEWDAAIPPLAVLLAEAERAQALMTQFRSEAGDAIAA